MIMPPRLHKFALTAHIATAVGWLGAVAGFLALSIVGLTSQNDQTVRGAYLVMEPAAWFILVPLALASLLTGLLMSLGTRWGLFRHYWVLFKLVINTFATIILLIYMETFSFMAGVAADPSADLGVVRNASPILHAALALLVLVVATVLAVFKPRGMTRHGWRKEYHQRKESQPILPQGMEMHSERDAPMADVPSHPKSSDDEAAQSAQRSTTATRWRLYVFLGIIGLVLLFILMHLIEGGIPLH